MKDKYRFWILFSLLVLYALIGMSIQYEREAVEVLAWVGCLVGAIAGGARWNRS